ncbi:hypothetical protein PanWU01x14_322040 [Parasponia andersonii]|uniref:Uncharacterized protein n=1 Tax=Parasponia andersonii TaxID=3476 RepID=A0A2P5AKZ7_PARAD|nr:hypothetical protein PanWU01x14_322040 [Parasponia andersonii]
MYRQKVKIVYVYCSYSYARLSSIWCLFPIVGEGVYCLLMALSYLSAVLVRIEERLQVDGASRIEALAQSSHAIKHLVRASSLCPSVVNSVDSCNEPGGRSSLEAAVPQIRPCNRCLVRWLFKLIEIKSASDTMQKEVLKQILMTVGVSDKGRKMTGCSS